MRPSIRALMGLVFAAGCTRLNPAFIDGGGSGSTTGTSGSSTSSSTTGDGSTTGGSTTDLCATTGGSTGMDCTLLVTNEKLEVSLKDGNGMPVCPETGTLETWLQRMGSPNSPNETKVVFCDDKDPQGDGCTGCTPDMATFTIDGPAAAIPAFEVLPSCFRVTLYARDDCSYTSVALWTEDSNTVLYPFYVAGMNTADPPPDLMIVGTPLTIETSIRQSCACDDCCCSTANTYDLTFSLPDVVNATVGPGESMDVLPPTDKTFRLHNIEAHDAVPCGAPPEIYWSFGDVDFLGSDG